MQRIHQPRLILAERDVLGHQRLEVLLDPLPLTRRLAEEILNAPELPLRLGPSLTGLVDHILKIRVCFEQAIYLRRGNPYGFAERGVLGLQLRNALLGLRLHVGGVGNDLVVCLAPTLRLCLQPLDAHTRVVQCPGFTIHGGSFAFQHF